MPDELVEIENERCLIVEDDGPVVRDSNGARDLIGEAISNRASLIAVPAARLDASFFQLRTGLAGEVLQKAANYRLKFVVVGDISEHVDASDALRDFVVECNRGNSIFFAPDLAALTTWLAGIQTSSG